MRKGKQETSKARKEVQEEGLERHMFSKWKRKDLKGQRCDGVSHQKGVRERKKVYEHRQTVRERQTERETERGRERATKLHAIRFSDCTTNQI